jgi:GT2 family glycosyltransferase
MSGARPGASSNGAAPREAPRRPLRIAAAVQTEEDARVVLPVAASLARLGAAVEIAAVGCAARARLDAIGCAHAAPDDSDWFFAGDRRHAIVMPLAPRERGGLLRHAAAEARRRGVPVLAVEIDPGRPAFDRMPGALAVAGGASFARALAAGWPEDAVCIAGSPLLDGLGASHGVARDARADAADRAALRFVVVSSFAFAPASDREALTQGLVDALAPLAGARLEIASAVAGRDAWGGAETLARRLRAAGLDASALPGDSWHDRIDGASAVLTEDLTAALLALAAGVSVAAIDWPLHPAAPGERAAPVAATALALPEPFAAAPRHAGAALRRAAEPGALDALGSARARAQGFVERGAEPAAERIGRLAFDLALAACARDEVVRAHLRDGNARLAAGSAADAERCYRAALGESPADGTALTNLALLLSARGDGSAAAPVLASLLDIEPDSVVGHLAGAHLLARGGDAVAAAEMLEALIERRPDASAIAQLAETYLDGGFPEQALPCFEAAARLGALGPAQRAAHAQAASLAGAPFPAGASAPGAAVIGAGDARPDAPGAAPDSDAGDARAAAGPRRLSIVIVAYNSADDLPACLDSIARTTRAPHEVIVVENGSSDGTRALLRSRPDVAVIESDANVGYARAANVGIARATGDAVVLLNPDTVLTPGWDARMLAHLAPGIGAVGPLSNYVAGEQKLELHAALPPGEIAIDEVAAIVAARNAGQGQRTKLLIGFCLLVTREALCAVGPLDADLFLGNDDLEYSLRLRRAGFSLVIATDAFVYHKGQASFATEPSEKTARLVQESTDALQEKLEAIYGAGSVPSPHELWGIGWFRPTRPAPMTSIVILTMNELAYTKACVAAIAAHTPEPHEIVFVDNGSTDGTPEWLDTVANARVIRNGANRGFAAGANQGIAAATGERILLMNNDVVVTEGWLSRLSRPLDADARVGLVGPVSNYVSGEQLDVTATYMRRGSCREGATGAVREPGSGVALEPTGLAGFDAAAMAAHARRVASEREGEATETRRLVGFCLLARAEVFRSVGVFDEGFGVGNFEDDDFSMRAVLGGWKLVIARDVFVHHFGSRTFAGNRIDYRAALERNKAYFIEKWQGAGQPA